MAGIGVWLGPMMPLSVVYVQLGGRGEVIGRPDPGAALRALSDLFLHPNGGIYLPDSVWPHRSVSLGTGVHQKTRDGIGWSQLWAGEYPPTMRATPSAFGCGGALSERRVWLAPFPLTARESWRISGAKEKAQKRGQPSEMPSSRGGGRLSHLGGFCCVVVRPRNLPWSCARFRSRFQESGLISHNKAKTFVSSKSQLGLLYSLAFNTTKVLGPNPSTLWLPIRGVETTDEPIRRDQRRRRSPIRSASTSAAAPDSLGHVSDREVVPTWARLTLTLV